MNVPAAREFRVPPPRDPSLVDFGVDGAGGGRRLELLGGVLVDRPLAMPDLPRRRTDLWREATARFEAGADGTGGWRITAPLPDPWRVAVPVTTATLSLEVRPAPSGQVGVFLEQVEQWDWLATRTPAGVRMLSLFAHSGGASLAMAAAGAKVVHVDASRQAIALARRNATASGLDAAPIRWVCEDARGFVAREVRRGTRYAGAVLDPPSWGHGPRGQAFAIDRDLAPLLADVARLLGAGGDGPAGPVLLSCHAARWRHGRLRDTLAQSCPPPGLESGPLTCTDAAGRTLPLGDFARWSPR
jgi:23S rRNA (cytosine1962-C5)-methyltransferase